MLPTRADMESAPTTRGMGFARSLRCLQRCNTKAKLAIKAEKAIYLKEKKYVFVIF